ncbi:hypothetical protein MKX72_20310 [Priestia sp. FSL R5-0597]|uniref:BC1872 family protein n=1 Tax=Priestia sp. FSL R5-0597 TaxID=2921580 RepID=UPI0030F68FCC
MNYDKIDRLIAVHVMGWEIKAVDFKQDGSFYEAYFDEKGNRLGLVGAYEFNPSEYIQDAWIILDKFTSFKIQDTFTGNIHASLFNGEWHKAQSSTTPLAICKAALKAKGIQI